MPINNILSYFLRNQIPIPNAHHGAKRRRLKFGITPQQTFLLPNAIAALGSTSHVVVYLSLRDAKDVTTPAQSAPTYEQWPCYYYTMVDVVSAQSKAMFCNTTTQPRDESLTPPKQQHGWLTMKYYMIW
uniref:Uncharacterized protein n=1 Tax=Craspedostauros australis TaxID=1486917 RepID=A0A7R9WUS7_9STRA|mmetsp:Transcript_21644/g.60245  ORF Transcript_21644/g.60245 Transcript_21644/m.60245 type:complete len:129 (+) Transcript_21644:103-489(+)